MIEKNHTFIELSQEFSELCKPLVYLGITHFTYQKQFNDGSRVSLSTKPQWVRDYYNLKLYDSSLFEKRPSDYKPTFNIWTGHYDLEVYRYGLQHYNTSHCISITEPQNDSCEHFLFSTSPDNLQSIQHLANNMNVLYHFILYLKDSGAKILERAENSKIQVQPSFDRNEEKNELHNSIATSSDLEKATNKFLLCTPIHRVVLSDGKQISTKISQRELMCITHLLNHKTAQETANLMGLSPRTVESYHENIKNKLRCQNRTELLNFLKSNKFLLSLLN